MDNGELGVVLFKCPVCDGAGIISRPPWVPGDVSEWPASNTKSYECHACVGKGVILVPSGES